MSISRPCVTLNLLLQLDRHKLRHHGSYRVHESLSTGVLGIASRYPQEKGFYSSKSQLKTIISQLIESGVIGLGQDQHLHPHRPFSGPVGHPICIFEWIWPPHIDIAQSGHIPKKNREPGLQQNCKDCKYKTDLQWICNAQRAEEVIILDQSYSTVPSIHRR